MPKSKTGKVSREKIVRSAVSRADKQGIDAVNLRSLADDLGVGAMTLYSYVDNKADLIAAMVDFVASEIEIPKPTTPWRDAITVVANSTKRTITKHSWVGPFWATGVGESKMAHQETILRTFRHAGFSIADACRGYHAVTMHAVGFALQALQYPTKPKALKKAAGDFLQTADEGRFPFFVEHIRFHFEEPESSGDFEFVLNAILDRLQSMLEEN